MDEDEESITDDTRKWRARGSNGSKMERYQLFSMHSPALQDLLNNPASVLVVTRRHVLHSWGFTGRRKPPAVQKKEKKRSRVPLQLCANSCKKKKPIHFLVYVLWNPNQGIAAPHKRGRPACGVNNAPISTPGQGQRLEELS